MDYYQVAKTVVYPQNMKRKSNFIHGIDKFLSEFNQLY